MAGAETIAVPLETVTPLFLAGAEPRGSPELRPPAFRGALRYWLRAALGGALGDNVAAVRAAESAVFGSTDERTGGASAVTIHVRQRVLLKPEPFPTLSRPPTGREYLYWSMAPSGRQERGNYVPPKYYYPQGTMFDLLLAARPGVASPTTALVQASAALWLLVYFGGIGSRARRTAGSLRVRETVEVAGLRFALTGDQPGPLTEQLAEGLRRVRTIVGQIQIRPTMPPSFDVLHPDVCRIWMLGVWRSVDAMIEEIGSRLREGRSKLPFQARALFGLPLQTVSVSRGRGSDTRVDRRASPLWLSVSRTNTGNAVAIATLFRSQFLSPGAQLQTRDGSVTSPRDYDVIEDWVQSAFPAAQEVEYA